VIVLRLSHDIMLLSGDGRKTLEKTEGAIKMDIPEKLAT
jgi:hypothetical protein